MKRTTAQLSLVFDPSTQGPRPAPPAAPPPPRFDGATYDPATDGKRLATLHARTFRFMAGGRWLTLAEIREHTGGSECSVSARVRDFRKPRFGAHQVGRRRKGGAPGVWEYRLIVRRGAGPRFTP